MTNAAGMSIDGSCGQDGEDKAAATKGCTPAARRVVRSGDLFAGDATELQIEHNGDLYCLRRTSKGKLILTK